MIEVEKKFILDENEEKRLLEGAEFISEKKIAETYYDTEEFALTKNDIWLRQRDGIFELKIPAHKNDLSSPRNYTEINGEENIRQIFGIIQEKSFLEDIESFGYKSFYSFIMTRKKYKKGKFTIDLDRVVFEDFEYSLVEIEIMVSGKEEILEAENDIKKFAETAGLKDGHIPGKVIKYISKKRPKHYEVLVEAGVVETV